MTYIFGRLISVQSPILKRNIKKINGEEIMSDEAI